MEREESHFFLFYKRVEKKKERKENDSKGAGEGRKDRREISELITQTKWQYHKLDTWQNWWLFCPSLEQWMGKRTGLEGIEVYWQQKVQSGSSSFGGVDKKKKKKNCWEVIYWYLSIAVDCFRQVNLCMYVFLLFPYYIYIHILCLRIVAYFNIHYIVYLMAH